MTVHGAKGLEAPIVFLPDMTSSSSDGKSDPLLMLDGVGDNAKVPLWPVPNLGPSKAVKKLKEERKLVQTAEYNRLLYVAMTRACDELYLCGYRGLREPAENCWYNTASDALTKQMENLGEAEGWRLGEAPVWAEKPAEARVIAAVDTPAWIAREVAQAPAFAAAPVARKRSAARVERGILIHRILQNLPELTEAERAAHIETAVRRAGADPALVAQLQRLTADPVLAEILSADGHSEASLITQRPDGSPERRRIDRLVVTPEGILVADYKTDREVPESPEACNPEYLIQLAIYREALRRTDPGKPLRFCLVYTEGPRLFMIPDALLDRMADLHQPRP